MRKTACLKHETRQGLLTSQECSKASSQGKQGSRQLLLTSCPAMGTAAALDAPRLEQAGRLPQSSLKLT